MANRKAGQSPCPSDQLLGSPLPGFAKADPSSHGLLTASKSTTTEKPFLWDLESTDALPT
jgi:hypothetical protein